MAVNPLEELALYPNMMKWRGTWTSSEQYFKNDIAISPLNTAPYILVGETAVLTSTDPSLDPLWEELAPAITGIGSIQAGAGITVTNPTGPVATVINDGVITVTQGTNISVDNTDPHNPIVSTNGVITGVQAGAGISVGGLTVAPTITNVGIRTLTVGAGLHSDNDPNNPSISSTGVLNITASTGISVSAGQTPTIANTGVISLLAGNAGITVNNTVPTAPVISNSGVISLTAGNGITLSGTAQNPIISAKGPILSSAGQFVATVTSPASPTNAIEYILTPPFPSPNAFTTYLSTGAPDATGGFMIDLSTVNLFLSGSGTPLVTDRVDIVIADLTTTAPTPIQVAIGTISMVVTNNTYPFQTRSGSYFIDVAAVRGTGFRQLDAIYYSNNTASATLESNTYGADFINVIYYPSGFQ